jgi:hypothetical protein
MLLIVPEPPLKELMVGEAQVQKFQAQEPVQPVFVVPEVVVAVQAY